MRPDEPLLLVSNTIGEEIRGKMYTNLIVHIQEGKNEVAHLLFSHNGLGQTHLVLEFSLCSEEMGPILSLIQQSQPFMSHGTMKDC